MLRQVLFELPQHRHHVFCIKPPPPPSSPDGAFVASLPPHAQVSFLGVERPSEACRGLRRLRRLVLHHGPFDVLQGWMYWGNMLALWVGLAPRRVSGSGGRVIFSNHLLSPRMPHLGWRSQLAAYGNLPLSYLAEAVVYVSPACRAAHLAMGFCRRNAQLIACGTAVPPQDDATTQGARLQLRARLGLPADVRLVGMLARLHPVKDHPTFLRAAARWVTQAAADVHFVLAGPGQQQAPTTLQPFISPSLAERLHFAGVPPDAGAFTLGLDLFCLASHSESFGMVVLEAMARQIPCVASQTGCLPALLQDVGLTVPRCDAPALCDAWQQALSWEPAARQARLQRGRQRVEEDYAARDMGQRFATLWAAPAAPP